MNYWIRPLSIVLFSFCIYTSYAQKGIKEHSWAKARPNIQTPAHLAGEDAFMVYQYRTVANHITDRYNGRIRTKQIVMRRTKILTQQGLEDHSVLVIRKHRSENLVSLDARTIKSKGKPVNLKTSEIKQMTVKDQTGKGGYEELRFAIPGVEVGDEIETVYATETSGLISGMDVNMHDELPIIHSVFVYRCDKEFNTNLKWVALGDPKITKDQNQVDYRWDTRNLDAEEDSPFALRPIETPVVSYVVRDLVLENESTGAKRVIPVVRNDAAALFDEFVRIYNASNSVQGSVKDLIEEFSAPGDSKETIISKLVDHLNKQVDIIPGRADGVGQDFKALINAGAMDRGDLYLLYWQIIKHMKLDALVCFGKSKFAEPIDVNFISPHAIDYVFFRFKGEDGKNHFIYPATSSYAYDLDEFPWYLQGTAYLAAFRKSVNALESRKGEGVIPNSSHRDNNERTTIECALNDDGTMNTTIRIKCTGVLAQMNHNLLEMEEGQSVLGLDAEEFESMRVFENDDTLFVEAKISSLDLNYQQLDDGSVSMNLEKLLNHRLINEVDTTSETLSLMPFLYEDQINMTITLDSEKKKVISKDANRALRSDVAMYNFNTKIDGEVLYIQSNYRIKKHEVNGQDAADLERINQHYELTKKRTLLLAKD